MDAKQLYFVPNCEYSLRNLSHDHVQQARNAREAHSTLAADPASPIMDFEAEVENEEQFWDELDDIVSTPCRTHERIDDTLRTWLGFAAAYRDQYLQNEQAITRCSLTLLSSSLFSKNDVYIRRQLVECLLQEDDTLPLHLVAAFLLHDGRMHSEAHELLNAESAFPRLVRFVQDGLDDDAGLHRLFIELTYEMSRMHQLSWSDLMAVDDAFVLYILQIVESLANDVNDPYHSPSIRVLLVLNEQYMVSSHTPSDQPTNLTNRVIKALSLHGRSYKTFGENLILLLNRESETSLQLLILKLLYLIFTTPSTEEYFYTNDLYVLTDILTRNLLDLPSSEAYPAAGPLKHTYLRVLFPLLANTQLRLPPFYKRDQLRRALAVLANSDSHFDAPDATTLRLVGRCLEIDWLKDTEKDSPLATPLEDQSTGDSVGATGLVARRALGMDLAEARHSSNSVMEMAIQKERPGVMTPSKARDPTV